MNTRRTRSVRSRRIDAIATIGVVMVMAVCGIAAFAAFSHGSVATAPPAAPVAVFADPTYSSPIVMSNDKAWVWVVNPDDDSVSVIRTDTDVEVARIRVGREPQSVAIDPDGEYAYVANAGEGSVSVIRVTSTSPFGAVLEVTYATGSEPWNVVISPDGKRVFVANSAQDTISVLKADVNFPTLPTLIGNLPLNATACNTANPSRHFQPRGMAVTSDNTKLYVTRFLSFVTPTGVEGTDLGKEGLVCRLTLNTSGNTAGATVTAYTPITLAAQTTGFVDGNGGPTSAYPNQMQSVVIRGDRAYLPSIAASPSGPLRFNADTQAFVNVIGGITGVSQTDLGALNLHLGARLPEGGKTKLFFSNPWAMAFTTQSGAGNAYVVSSGSDLLVKLNVDAGGAITFTGGVSTTRYIDLNDPAVPATSGRSAGKNPIGIVLRNDIAPGKAYVANYVGRNVSVVNLSTDAVIAVVPLQTLPVSGSIDEQLQVGKEIFFSSRGHFVRPITATVSTDNRLSSEGWQTCSSCHFNGWTDGEIWKFAAGPRKSVPLNGTFSPHNANDQRVLNYSAIFDEVQDFEINIRNVSGPGALAGGALDPNHGLLISDTGGLNFAPTVVNPFAKANAGRPQLMVQLSGSATAWPALDSLAEWVRRGIRTPNGALTTGELSAPPTGIAANPDTTGGLSGADVTTGRRLFFQAGCGTCHAGSKWTASRKDFASPPGSFEIATEGSPLPITGNPVSTTQYLTRFLASIGSFNLNVTGQGNLISGTPSIGAVETNERGLDGLGKDYNGDGKGVGFNIPSLLGIWHLPPYYHNGACETLACVLADSAHRQAGLKPGQLDPLATPVAQAKVVEFLKTLDEETVFPLNLFVNRHNIFLDPPTVFSGTTQIVGVNLGLFGSKTDLANLISDLGLTNTLRLSITFQAPGAGPVVHTATIRAADFNQNFGFAVYTTTFSVPAATGIAAINVVVDPSRVLPSDAGNIVLDDSARRLVLVRAPPADITPPKVNAIFISDDVPFNDLDPVVTTTNVKVKIVAEDVPSPVPASTSGVRDFCIVRYFYDVILRRWVENTCTFGPLPPPASGTTNTFTVTAFIPPFEGTAYAFAWVRDAAGNISRTPGFDVVSFIPATPINMTRNDVRVFRLLVPPSQALTVTASIAFGDVDLSLFDGVGTGASRIGVSANNGTTTETVALSNVTGANKLFQVEVRAIVNSRFTLSVAQGPSVGAGSPAAADMLVSGPPALQSAIDSEWQVYVPNASRAASGAW